MRGTSERPRLSVTRSHKHMTAQIVDDTTGKTLVAASTIDKELSGKLKYGGNQAAAQAVGKAIAQRAKAAGIAQVCFRSRSVQVPRPRGRVGDRRARGRIEFLVPFHP